MGKIDLSIQGSLNNDALVREFRILESYEIDGDYLLDQAISDLKNPDSQEALKKIKTECEVNIRKLSSIIENLGGEAPSHTRDFTGLLMQGYVAVRGLLGDKGTLQALKTDMNLILKAYESAVELYMADDVRSSLEETYSKAKKRIDTIESLINA